MKTPVNPPGRNEPCYCGSGRKYKQCCLDKDEAAARAAQPWKRAQNTRGFHKVTTPRKVGGG